MQGEKAGQTALNMNPWATELKTFFSHPFCDTEIVGQAGVSDPV